MSKDLKLQNVNYSYVPTNTMSMPPSFGKYISCSFLHQFEHFLLHWMRHLKLFKTFLKVKDDRLASKDLKI
jgi:hypothetical protein